MPVESSKSAPLIPEGRPGRRARREALSVLVPLAVYAVAITEVALTSPYVLSDFPLDDAWIHQAYARSLAWGSGFAYNPGAQETGATSPLWVLLLAPAHWLAPIGGTFSVVLCVKGLGVLLGAATCVLCHRIARQLTDSHVVGMISAALLSLEPRLHYAAFSGMETLLLVALWLAATSMAIEGRFLLSLALAGLLPVARPEAILVVPLILAGVVIAHGTSHGIWKRPLTWVVLLAPTVMWTGFCTWATGSPLPNTFHIKATAFTIGVQHLMAGWEALVQHGWASQKVLLLGILVWILSNSRQEGRAWFARTLLILAPGIYMIGVLGTRNYSSQGYYWTRWTDPPVLLWTASIAIGLALVLSGRWSFDRKDPRHPESMHGRTRALSAVALIAAAVAISWCGPRLLASYTERRYRLASDCRSVHLVNVEPALWISENTPVEATVGVHDAGAMRFFGGRLTVDLLGLNDSLIASGRVDFRERALDLDWLVSFRAWIEESDLLGHFLPEVSFRMPPDEYTICSCPEQAQVVVARRSGSGFRIEEVASHPGSR